jgi:glutamate synthase domain-containing protein 2
MEAIGSLGLTILEILAMLFAVGLGTMVLYTIYLYWTDSHQTAQAIRRNYPVVGRFRYFLEHLGVFLRQYFFAQDREELPFNRAQRAWVYRAAKNLDNTLAFGSTQPIDEPGVVIFLNDFVPVLQRDAEETASISFGEGYAETPYSTSKYFHISGMSFGALSAPAVRALSRGAQKAGIWMNTGEGGLSPYHLEGGCDLVFQIGTAKYGVKNNDGSLSEEKLRSIAAHTQVRMFEIKLSQGAKPGKGGILPAAKVTDEIATIRGIPTGEASISPNRHEEVDSVEDLLDMIYQVRKITGKPVGFKAVIGHLGWLDDLCRAIIVKGLDYAPDFMTIDSGDGGTGAAPQSLIDYMGLPIKRSLPAVVDKLTDYGLRERVRVVCSGKLINPSNVAWALCVGADAVVTARGFLFALGCVQSLQCNRNTCPTGITTHNPKLQKGLVVQNKSERVNYFARNLAHEVETIAHSCGVPQPRALSREHIEIIDGNGMPRPMSALYSDTTVSQASVIASDKQ